MKNSKLRDVLNEIDQNDARIKAFGKIGEGVLKKINYKFRLDWNYNSNRMEGGTLTQAETRSVMVGNIDINGKPIKDVIEMSGHDTVVRELLRVGKGEKRLSEKRIKDIHKSIIHEEDSELKKQIGEWKTGYNEIINYKDEKINFTPPEDVVEAIHDLLNRTNAYLDNFFKGKHKAHPVSVISKFHLDYLMIHPFYDGNGRTARILTNLLLISCGLPPIIIKNEEKESYYQILGDIQGYGGKEDLFFVFIGERVIESQNLVLKALNGESIEEPDDLDKRIALLERELAAVDQGEEIQVKLDYDYFEDILNGWLGELIKEAIPVIQKFNHFFTRTQHYISAYPKKMEYYFENEHKDVVLVKLKELIENSEANSFYEREPVSTIRVSYGTFTKGGLKTFGCNYTLDVRFDAIKYSVWVDVFNPNGEKEYKEILSDRLLHKPLSSAEIKQVVNVLGNSIIEHIEYHAKAAGLKRNDNEGS